MKKISVEALLQQAKERLHLTPMVEEGMASRHIVSVDINRLGMALTGYFKWFAYERLQILGKTEIHYLQTLKPAQRREIFHKIFSYSMPCIIVTHKMKPPAEMVAEARSIVQHPELVIPGTFFGIADNRIGLADLLKLFLGCRVVRVDVRVKLTGKPAVCRLQLVN